MIRVSPLRFVIGSRAPIEVMIFTVRGIRPALDKKEEKVNHLYESKDGIIHACEKAEVHPGIILVWTLCDKDVPAGKSFKSKEKVTCDACELAINKARTG